MSSLLSPPANFLWIVATAVLLVLGINDWMALPESSRFHIPETPIDLTNSAFADQWRFLRQVERYLPPDARLTIVGPDRHADMSLFMMALGTMTEFRPLPFSYFQDPKPEYSYQADYVLAYRCEPSTSNVRLVRTLEHGAIYKRVGN